MRTAATPSPAWKPSRCFLGVDVGGTFTDLVFFTDTGDFYCVKVPSTPSASGLSTLQGVDEIRSTLAIPPAVWAAMHHTHSSTVATNALIERSGTCLGFITTRGFRDLLELQRLATPRPTRYDSRRPMPLVRREMVREAAERIDVSGQVLLPLDTDGVVAAASELQALGASNIAICFMHSYRNPVHELEAKRAINEALGDLRVELSCEVWPQAREFERATLTCINAFIRPIVEGHVLQLAAGLSERGIATPPRGARSNGGMELLTSLAERPVTALLSGPAAGVSGAAAAALDAGWAEADLITIDVGGTSADIGVIRRGRPVLSSEEHVADFPILIPTIAVSAIGAGGGSIIWVDPTGSLKVGPRSVGADPGPACYGHAQSTTPALTDAFLLAGFLAPGQRLGNKMALNIAPARRALQTISDLIALTLEQTADGAIQIATAMMAAEATRVLARRGVDAPRFRMVAFGGAGPLLAALVAEEIYIDSVLIPPTPGALGAFGAARADLEGDFVRPVYQLMDALKSRDVAAMLNALRSAADEWLEKESHGLSLMGSLIGFSADMRYDGQGYDVAVPIDPDWFVRGTKDDLARAFHSQHQTVYGHNSREANIWLKELRAHVIGCLIKPTVTVKSPPEIETPSVKRQLRLRGSTFQARVVQRACLPERRRIQGPAIIEQMDTTTLVPDGWTIEAVAGGAMVLSRSGRMAEQG